MSTATRIQATIRKAAEHYRDNSHGEIIFLCDFIGYVSGNLLPEDAEYMEAMLDRSIMRQQAEALGGGGAEAQIRNDLRV